MCSDLGKEDQGWLPSPASRKASVPARRRWPGARILLFPACDQRGGFMLKEALISPSIASPGEAGEIGRVAQEGTKLEMTAVPRLLKYQCSSSSSA